METPPSGKPEDGASQRSGAWALLIRSCRTHETSPPVLRLYGGDRLNPASRRTPPLIKRARRAAVPRDVETCYTFLAVSVAHSAFADPPKASETACDARNMRPTRRLP